MSTVSVRYMIDDVPAAIQFYTTYLGFSLDLDASPAFQQAGGRPASRGPRYRHATGAASLPGSINIAGSGRKPAKAHAVETVRFAGAKLNCISVANFFCQFVHQLH